jgi:hypothetical protein
VAAVTSVVVPHGSTLRELCQTIDETLTEFIGMRDIAQQPDARAFGGYVEAAVLASWPDLCVVWCVAPLAHPGRRTIYDASFKAGDLVVGVDFRTKDLAKGRYSDGGICAVGNLLRWMVKERSTLLVTEFGYTIDDEIAAFAYVATAPIHALPSETYRIENLGTGQLRLNASVRDILPTVAWDRTAEEFFEAFSGLCLTHYDRVRVGAAVRLAAVEDFVASGYTRISLK